MLTPPQHLLHQPKHDQSNLPHPPPSEHFVLFCFWEEVEEKHTTTTTVGFLST
jgi:hypothetical protein